MDLLIYYLTLQFAISAILLLPIFWGLEKIFACRKDLKFVDSLWIISLGTIVYTLFFALSSATVASLIVGTVLVSLAKTFLNCNLTKAVALSAVGIATLTIVAILLGLAGLAVSNIWL